MDKFPEFCHSLLRAENSRLIHIVPEPPAPLLSQKAILDYLKQYRRVTYTNLLTSGRLNTYLADIDKQAQERFERLIEGMKQAQGHSMRISIIWGW